MIFSLEEFERFLIRVWMIEITESMMIEKPENENEFIDAIMALRGMLKVGGRIQMAIYLFRNWNSLKKVRPYFGSLSIEDSVIMFVPFLTTIDTTLFNFVQMRKPKRLVDLFELVPFKAIPMECNGEIVIAELVSNNADNPGNSVFGPKGVICPGNIVTSLLVKAMIELMNNLEYQVVGETKWVYKAFMGYFEGGENIRIECKAFNKIEVERLVCDVDDNVNDV